MGEGEVVSGMELLDELATGGVAEGEELGVGADGKVPGVEVGGGEPGGEPAGHGGVLAEGHEVGEGEAVLGEGLGALGGELEHGCEGSGVCREAGAYPDEDVEVMVEEEEGV